MRSDLPAPAGLVSALPYNRAGAVLRREIAWLQHRADPAVSPAPREPIPPEHDPAFEALSFYIIADQRVVSYAAVVYITIRHAGEPLTAAGLSCVATDPAYRRHGLGSLVVAAATRSILDSTVDLGLFTCDPPLTPFYERAGGWQVVPDVVLLGNQRPDALTSVGLGKAVLMRLVSDRAQRMALALEHAVIDLNLPPGQFV